MGTAEANAAVVLDAFEAFNAGDTNRLEGVIAPDLVAHPAGAPAPVRGRESWREGVALMKRAFPDLEARVEDVVAEEAKVAIRVTYRGTHADDFEASRPPAGRSSSSVTSSTASKTG